MKGNQKDVCEKQAKANEKVAKAELDAKKDPSPRNQRKVAEAKADGEYDVAKEKCDDLKGNEKSACEKQAKAKHEQAQADIKKQYAQKDAKSSATRVAHRSEFGLRKQPPRSLKAGASRSCPTSRSCAAAPASTSRRAR
jgi:hypothetical protein